MDKKKYLKATTTKKNGKLLAIASTENEDRMGDSLKLSDWDLKNYVKNPVLQAGHDHSPQFTIGIAKNIRFKDGQLVFEPLFHEVTQLARDIKAMYESEPAILKAWSVGFIPNALKMDSEGNKLGKNELLEVSAVAVPANAECLTMAKAYGDNEVKSIEQWIKKEVDIKKEEKKEEVKEAKKELMNIERWNKQLPKVFDSKEFDINKITSEVTTFEYKLYTGYLDCEVRHLNLNNFLIPSPMLGSYLAGFKAILGNYKVIDERSFSWNGTEKPINYEVIKLNSKEDDDFMVDGVRFYESNTSKKKFIVKFEPCFYGLQAQIITLRKDKDWNKETLLKVKEWVDKNNKLRGEAFALSGEFINRGATDWESIILPKTIKGAVMKGVGNLKKDGIKAKSRGMMFVGMPGTGKTLTGKAMMADLKDKTFIWVSAKDFEIMKYAKQDALSLAFKMVRQLGPAVLFLEDIDGWLKYATSIDMLKTELDGIQENNGLITVLTSNNPEELPDALLDRPGRFHDVLEFDLPSSELRKKMITEWTGIKDFTGSEMNKLLDNTESFSGAHMRELIDFAKMIDESDKVGLKKALFESLDKLIEQRKLIERIKDKKKVEVNGEKGIKKDNTMDFVDIIDMISEEKEGRVLSKTNKELITKSVSLLKDTTVALEKILEMSEPKISNNTQAPGKVKGDGQKKGRNVEVVKVSEAEKADMIVLRSLQKIAGLSAKALNQKKKTNK